MELKVLGSSSRGNCYILENEKEALILEAGISLKEVKRALNYNTSKIVGCLVSHEHGDHAGFIDQYIRAGIDIYSHKGVFERITQNKHRQKVISTETEYNLGSFKFASFELEHDVFNLGFLINHSETGNFIFVNDTSNIPYKFKKLNNIIIEANYSESTMDHLEIHEALKNRIRNSHMALEKTILELQAMDLSEVENIVLVHLSNSNSSAEIFKQEVIEATGKIVHVAEKGMVINFNKTI